MIVKQNKSSEATTKIKTKRRSPRKRTELDRMDLKRMDGLLLKMIPSMMVG